MKKSKGGVLGTIFFGIFAIALVFAFATVNDINSVDDVYKTAKRYSDYADDCSDGPKLWNCDGILPPDNGESGKKSGQSSSSEENPPDPARDKSKTDGRGNGESLDEEKKKSTEVGVDAPFTKERFESALKTLDTIPVKKSKDSDYSRSDWKHWVGGKCDNTREQVLKESGKNVKLDSNNCKVVSGEWVGPYNGKTITSPKKIDIDHVIPLNYANRNGGDTWDTKKKQQFANDKRFLLATSAAENRSKSDSGPSDYLPPNKEFTCEYSTLFVEGAHEYGLSLPKEDSETLRKELKKCS